MDRDAWWKLYEDNREALEGLVQDWHPARVLTRAAGKLESGELRVVAFDGDHPPRVPEITAPAAEAACREVRAQIAEATRGENPLADLRAAAEGRRDAAAVSLILGRTWFGVPESREVHSWDGFGALCDLCSEFEPTEEELGAAQTEAAARDAETVRTQDESHRELAAALDRAVGEWTIDARGARPATQPNPACTWCHGRGWAITVPNLTLEGCDACGVFRTDEEAYRAAIPVVTARPPLYVELHVVVSGLATPAWNDDATAARHLFAWAVGWWASRLTAEHGDEEHAGDWILTSRAPDRAAGLTKLRELSDLALRAGFGRAGVPAPAGTRATLARWKIEEVTFDTKRGDVL